MIYAKKMICMIGQVITGTAMNNVDLTKPQVFDPPVKMLVSNQEDFPGLLTYERNVYCVFPEFEYPIHVHKEVARKIWRRDNG